MELMTHSSTFLLPNPSADNGPAPTYVLVVLNRNLPRFTPLLWKHGDLSCTELFSGFTLSRVDIFFYLIFFFRLFCRAAQLRICADGGANRLYDELPLLFPDQDAIAIRKRYKPNLIKGDLDSIREEVLGFYKDVGTEVIDASDDQDTTDLHKCIAYIQDLPNLKNQNVCVLVAGALGGRFDHEVGNINVLCRFSSMRIILLSDDCLIQLLPSSHHHEIHIQHNVEGPHCGLIPIGGPSTRNKTTGLEWNLSDTEMRFGGLVSTSNIVKGEIVTVQSDSDLLWTISIRKE